MFNLLLIETPFNKDELFFLLNNQNSTNISIINNNCIFCESFFIKFIKLFSSKKYFIYVNIYCMHLDKYLIIHNVAYYFAI